MFKIYVNDILKTCRRQCQSMGITVVEHSLFTLFYTKDQRVLAEDSDDRSCMVRKLKECYKTAGLTIDLTKSEYIFEGKNNVEDLPIKASNIPRVYHNWIWY